MSSLAELQPQNIMYEQDKNKPFEPLPERLSSELLSESPTRPTADTAIGLYYINSYGMEIHPSPNPDFLANLRVRDVLVYSCGSLWTRYGISRSIGTHIYIRFRQHNAMPCTPWGRWGYCELADAPSQSPSSYEI